MDALPTHIAGIPLWVVVLVVVSLLLFFLKFSGDSTSQDRYPTAKLFAYIVAIFIAIIGIVDFIRWANLW
jgi:hypothetical protein